MTASLVKCLLVFSCCSVFAHAQIIEPLVVKIPSGSYMMGSDFQSNEQPKHKVNINAFYISKYEVTVGEFAEFVKATGHQTNEKCWWWQKNHEFGFSPEERDWKTSSNAPSSFHPVMCVTWDDAQAYSRWLSKETGKSYRLPSEAEWEYAARAGSQQSYFYGDNSSELCAYGNVYDLSGYEAIKRDFSINKLASQCDDFAEYTSVIGMYQANAFGLFDTIGNVSEYVEDCEHFNYQAAPMDGSAWLSGCNKQRSMKIRRGGTYGAMSPAKDNRSAARAHAGQTNASAIGEGFRLALDMSSSNDGYTFTSETLQFEKTLKQAQIREQKRRDNLVKRPKAPQGLILSKGKSSKAVELKWKMNKDGYTTSYNVYRQSRPGSVFELIAEKISGDHFSDSKISEFTTSYAIKALNGSKVSVMSDKVTMSSPILTVPGVLKVDQAADIFGFKGEYSEDKVYSLGWTQKGYWVDFDVKVEAVGAYEVVYTVGSEPGSQGLILLSDGHQIDEQTIESTGGWHEWQQMKGKIKLKSGKQTLRVLAAGGDFNFQSFSLNKI